LPYSLELCSLTVHQASLPELIDVAAQQGFDSLTTTPGQIAASGVDAPTLRRRCEDAGVRIHYLDGLASPLPGVPPAGIGEIGEDVFFALAEALGVPTFNLVHFGGDPDVPLDAMAEAVSGLADRAAEHDVDLVFEFIPGTAVPDLPTALELARVVDSDRFRILLDTWHLARGGGGPELLVGDAPALVGALQVSDRRREQDSQPYVPMSGRYLPGDGELPLVEMLQPVLDAHPDIPVGIEVANEALWSLPPGETAALAADAIRALVAQVTT
jgi:sugar phosphate isomerase/epimerase